MTASADMKTAAKRRVRIALVALGIFLLLFAVLGGIILSCGLCPLAVEAGEDTPAASDFLRFSFLPLSCQSDLTDPALGEVGTHTVQFTFLGIPMETTLSVRDTTPPRFTVKGHGIRLGEEVSPEDFLLEIEDASPYTAEVLLPDGTDRAGVYPVQIRLTDAWGNRAEQSAKLAVFDLPPALVVELGADRAECESTLQLAIPQAVFAEDVDTSHLGEAATSILLDGFTIPLSLHIQDTIPPTASTRNIQIASDEGEIPQPGDFIAWSLDASEITVAYEGVPDFKTPGKRTLTLILCDAAGNTAKVRARLIVTPKEGDSPSVLKDLPTIQGVKPLSANVGMWISYTTGVSARDAEGNSLTVKVDSSAVQRNVPGTYTVTYTATDKMGRVATVRTTVTVREITETILKPYVDKVLGKILKDGMTKREQARAIYDWMRANVSYTAYAYKDHWMRAAYSGFVNGRGDCYVYYAMSRALLDGAGIENMEICRDNPAKPHYWNLVNCGDGWYHFDTCPHYKDYPLESFMLTDQQVKAYSENCVKDYYSFDSSLYPATP